MEALSTFASSAKSRRTNDVQNYEKDLNLTDISRMYSLSTTHFGTQFKKVMGVGFKEYLTITRISAAKAMFKSGEKCVSKVAYSCGFNDSNYFSDKFKKVHGMSPLKYRQKYRRKFV